MYTSGLSSHSSEVILHSLALSLLTMRVPSRWATLSQKLGAIDEDKRWAENGQLSIVENRSVNLYL
jgi:hypothetical protein